jgi:hypothetical protein
MNDEDQNIRTRFVEWDLNSAAKDWLFVLFFVLTVMIGSAV